MLAVRFLGRLLALVVIMLFILVPLVVGLGFMLVIILFA